MRYEVTIRASERETVLTTESDDISRAIDEAVWQRFGRRCFLQCPGGEIPDDDVYLRHCDIWESMGRDGQRHVRGEVTIFASKVCEE